MTAELEVECNVGGEFKCTTAFKKIREAALKVMTHYQMDLDIDEQCIHAHPWDAFSTLHAHYRHADRYAA